MYVRTATMTVALTVLAGCGGVSGGVSSGVSGSGAGGGSATTDQQTYQIAERIDALVIDARAAAVILETGDGPITVNETYRFGNDRPTTSHRVDGTTLRLTDTGCRDDSARCDVEFRVHLPAATGADITAQAGAVRITGLTGDLAVSTQAGAIEGSALGGDAVRVSTQAGAMALQFTRAPAMVRASTQVGAVEVQVPSGTSYAVDVQTTLGRADVSVQRDPASPHKIEIRTNVGAVKVGNG
jgi:hypothetical protein